MQTLTIGALPCLLVVQAAAQAPLTFQEIQAKARPAPEQWRSEVLLSERRIQSQESRGFLREGPTVSMQVGPRRTPGIGTNMDKGFEIDLPLFFSSRVRTALESSLGKAHPLMTEAARREGLFRLKNAYLDAWLASRMAAFRMADLVTVDQWLEAAKARLEAGADPALQVSLVEGERLKVQQELDEARVQESRTWGTLVALADLPSTPVALADPGAAPTISPVDLDRRVQDGPIRKALLAQVVMETESLRLKEAISLSRWSLRGSYAQEGEDKVTRIGIAVRLPRPGESAAVRSNTEAQVRAIQGEARQALAELDARAEAACKRLKTAPASATIPDFAKALEAVGLRLQEGRERPSEALPIRRQLLDAQMASLRRIHAQHLLVAELQTLLPEVNP